MSVYYNENGHFAAAWLRELIKEGLIADGFVDERSIKDVQPADLRGYTQHHFFAGIGGWSYALRLAGWPEDKPVWTGSCPCQPFSVAGKRKGTADDRHLWPEFRRLIDECEPAIVFGEQVASKDGRVWLAGVRADLEALGYAVGGADLCAASVSAPHIRQRLYWVADAKRDSRDTGRVAIEPCEGTEEAGPRAELGRRGVPGGMGHHHHQGLQGWRERPDERTDKFAAWSASVAIPCADGKFRRVAANEAGEPEPSLFPLAHGFSNRVGILRGAGNAIAPNSRRSSSSRRQRNAA